MDHATPNLPSIDFGSTAVFYSKIGFEEAWRDKGWMILKRGPLILEFFPHPTLKPAESWFSCCLRIDDLASFFAACQSANIPEKAQGFPRLHPPKVEASGLTIAYMCDLDGTLIRIIQN